ncbi:multiheme c-type cytochrome [Desulfovulcanus sp.]
MNKCRLFLSILGVVGLLAANAIAGDYVGSKKCGECHEQEYNNFLINSKKANAQKYIKVMAPKLTEEELRGCYECHTTGYKKGGFVSYDETPHLADVGCETCHGPGKKHVEAGGDPELIKGKLSPEDCKSCHTESRVKIFKIKPLIHGGVH